MRLYFCIALGAIVFKKEMKSPEPSEKSRNTGEQMAKCPTDGRNLPLFLAGCPFPIRIAAARIRRTFSNQPFFMCLASVCPIGPIGGQIAMGKDVVASEQKAKKSRTRRIGYRRSK
jgi:hypothetical protein